MKKRMHNFKGQSKKKLIAKGLVSAVLLGAIASSNVSQVSAEVNDGEAATLVNTPKKTNHSKSHRGRKNQKRKSRRHKRHSRRYKMRYTGDKSKYDSFDNTYEQEPDTSEKIKDLEQPTVPAPEELEEKKQPEQPAPEKPEESKQPAPEKTEQPAQPTSSINQAALDTVNELRANNNLPPLVYNEQLGDAAQTIAQNNHDNRGLTHAHDDAAVEASGYTGDSALANLGYNSAGTTAEGGVNQLYGSSGHRKQMLAPYWTEFGYGEVTGPNGTYFTQFFGTQKIDDISEYNNYNNYIGSNYSNPTVPLDSYNGR